MKQDEIEKKVFEAIGQASMCWSETPKGVFDSKQAEQIGDDLLAYLLSKQKPSEVSEIIKIPISKILRLDEPYSLPEILKALTECADILLHDKGYDGDGWERLEYAYRHGKEIVSLFENESLPQPLSEVSIEKIIEKSEIQAKLCDLQDMRDNNVESAYWSWFIIKLKQNLKSLSPLPSNEAVKCECGNKAEYHFCEKCTTEIYEQ